MIKFIYLQSAKDPGEAKYQLPINKRESIGLKHLNDSKAFIEYYCQLLSIYLKFTNYVYTFSNKNIYIHLATKPFGS